MVKCPIYKSLNKHSFIISTIINYIVINFGVFKLEFEVKFIIYNNNNKKNINFGNISTKRTNFFCLKRKKKFIRYLFFEEKKNCHFNCLFDRHYFIFFFSFLVHKLITIMNSYKEEEKIYTFNINFKERVSFFEVKLV